MAADAGSALAYDADVDTSADLNAPHILSLDGVTLSYGANLVLDRITLGIASGEFLCIVGPSGCGKTTLLRLLAGHVTASSGTMLFKNAPITKPSRDRAIVFQDYSRSLLPWRKVWANVALALEGQGLSKRDRRERSQALLAQMNLAHVADLYPGALSGGMQQRVQIARCLAQEPSLLLMDEPFGALDAITRQSLQDEVSRLAAEKDLTVVFITHDLEEAIYLGDRVVSLAARPGRVGDVVKINLPRPRNQLTTREEPLFLQYRHRLFKQLERH
ncbi:ABC transporter ATP-binding protein [Pseudolabrys sp. FHR47]|uniref:ABC transporter ATP-binding protein n=1 Tax=Pseudolabrys sp. FHR47 TaxID=2562284 RepID=UPI001981C2CC|nr:ABC transporter ATP-binding protein [Pseudolabrys sp. FHR47]